MQRILLIDNYDSFVHNLSHLVGALGAEVEIVPNNLLHNIDLQDFDRMLISPGPGLPEEAEELMPTIHRATGILPILGVCLGHQAIAQAFGATLYQHEHPLHGIESSCHLLCEDALWQGLPPTISVGRYHSWSVAPQLPPELSVTATSDDGTIMAIRHKSHDICGLQFHPESILTPLGAEIMENWIYNTPVTR